MFSFVARAIDLIGLYLTGDIKHAVPLGIFLAENTVVTVDILTDVYTTYDMYTKLNETCEWHTSVPFFASMAGIRSRFNVSNLENE